MSDRYIHGVYLGFLVALTFLAMLISFGPFDPSLYGWHGHINPFSIGILAIQWTVVGMIVGTISLGLRLRLLSLHEAHTVAVSTRPAFANRPEIAEGIDWIHNSYPGRFHRNMRIGFAALPFGAAVYALLAWSVWNSPQFSTAFVEAYGVMIPVIPAIVAVVYFFGEKRTVNRVGFGPSGVHLDYPALPPETSATYVAWADVRSVKAIHGPQGVLLDTAERPIRVPNIDKIIIDRILWEHAAWGLSSSVKPSPAPAPPPS